MEMEHTLSTRALLDHRKTMEEVTLRHTVPLDSMESVEEEEEEEPNMEESPKDSVSAMEKSPSVPAVTVSEPVVLVREPRVSTKLQLQEHAHVTVVQHPKVAWLMSFPNSGTSFTIHMTREASNTTTATNYALEGEIRDKPSVPVIAGKTGDQGPWLELIPGRETSIPERYIITKTHCKGFCTGRYCGADKIIQPVRTFMEGCATGTRAVETKQGLEKIDTTYRTELVGKAIHIFRHPLDNIVARFHLEYNVQMAKGRKRFAKAYPKNEIGFKRWCAKDDSNRSLLSHRLVDDRLRAMMLQVPCFNEFFRYVQWHNLAFATTREMDVPTMLLHYQDFSTDFEGARDRVLDWLELPRVANGVKFQDGKVYRSYYSREEKRSIRDFLQAASSGETWSQLKEYDYESNEAPAYRADVKLDLSAVL